MDLEIKGVIKSEDPAEHWGFLPVEGEIILDLGCGINNADHISTPVYWITNKASYIIGIDASPESYELFKKHLFLRNFVNIMDYIDRIEKFELYLGYYKPTVVKIDVEGGELYLNGLDSQYLDSVKHIAIEYHNLPCLVSCKRLLEENNYTIDYYKFESQAIDHQGVIHGYKK
jgi:SAM-dependent methyltransferase